MLRREACSSQSRSSCVSCVRRERTRCEFGLERGTLLEEGGTRPRVHVVEQLERIEVGLGRHDLPRTRSELLCRIRDLCTHCFGERTLGDEVLLEALDGVAALPVLH